MKSNSRSWLKGRAARGYLRVSSKAQGDKYGPAAQRADEVEAANQHESCALTAFYEDHLTGTNAYGRQDFQRMVVDAKAGAFEVLFVGRVDRFARSERDGWNYLYALAEAGVAIYFVEEDVLVPHDPDWQDAIGAEINGAAGYSRKLSRNVRKGLRAKAASGAHVGGVPFGYERAADGKLQPDRRAAPIRALAFELYGGPSAATYQSVADDLNSRGLRFMSGRLFTASAVGEILNNPIAIGTLQHRSGLEQGAVMPIVSPELWDAVRRRIVEQRGASRKPGQQRHTYTFSGVVRCGDCGELYWNRMQQQSRGSAAPQLIHSPRGCRQGALSEAEANRRLAAWLAEWRLDTKSRTEIAEWLNRATTDDGTDSERKVLETRLRQLAKQHEWAALSDEEFLAARGRLVRAIESLPVAQPRRAAPEEALALVDSLGVVWPESSPEHRAAFVREWFSELRLHRDGHIEVQAREPYFPIVAAALGRTTAGAAPWALLGSNQSSVITQDTA